MPIGDLGKGSKPMKIEFDREDDGRWIADIPALPGVMVYGDSQAEARDRAETLAFRVLADRLEHGESVPGEVREIFDVR
jgi:predicted RNase H-like HicB family nuclease